MKGTHKPGVTCAVYGANLPLHEPTPQSSIDKAQITELQLKASKNKNQQLEQEVADVSNKVLRVERFWWGRAYLWSRFEPI